jgi:hypothetical protein
MMKKIIYPILLACLMFSLPCYAGPVINVPAAGLAADADAIAGTDTTKSLTAANLRAVVLDDVADAALSGTPVILGIKDKDGNTYYFKGYPTKTAY